MNILLSRLLLNVQLLSKPFFRGHVYGHGGRSSIYWDSPRTLDAAASGGAERRAFFCSDVEAQYREELPTEVVALPLTDKPLFLGPIQKIMVKDKKLHSFLHRELPEYVAAFLLKNEPGTNRIASHVEVDNGDLQGEVLYDRLHSVGTLAEVIGWSFQSRFAVFTLRGHKRVRKNKMLCEDPLIVKVDHLEDKPFDKDDDVIREMSDEIIMTLSEIAELRSQWIDRALIKIINENKLPSLADFGAAISGHLKMQASDLTVDPKLQIQQVLADLDVRTRLKVAATLVNRGLYYETVNIGCEYGWPVTDDKKGISDQLSKLLQERAEAVKSKKAGKFSGTS